MRVKFTTATGNFYKLKRTTARTFFRTLESPKYIEAAYETMEIKISKRRNAPNGHIRSYKKLINQHIGE